MKSICYLLLAFGFLVSCSDSQSNQQDKPITSTTELTDIQWTDSAKNLGKITEGQVLEVAFRFRNTGTKPLVIRSVRPGCGCTVANPPAEPIAPGAEGEIKASFNSKGRSGINHKEIDVDANTTGSQLHKIAFTVEVIPQQTPQTN